MSYTVEHFTVVPLKFRGIKNKLSVKPDVYTTALISVAQLYGTANETKISLKYAEKHQPRKSL